MKVDTLENELESLKQVLKDHESKQKLEARSM